MKQKTNCVGPQERGQVKRKVEAGSGRRKFLTTIAGAGAAIALLGSRSAAAQEKKKLPDATSMETSKKTINKDDVKRLLNTENKELDVEEVNFFGGDPRTGTKNFRYDISEKKGGFSVMISSKKAGWKEEVVFPGIKKEDANVAIFKPKGNDAIADELLVFAGRGKIAVCFQDKNHGTPVLMQFSGAKQETSKVKIGYENKDGEVVVISAPKKVGKGDKVLAVKVSGNGIISSTVLECSEATMAVIEWG